MTGVYLHSLLKGYETVVIIFMILVMMFSCPLTTDWISTPAHSSLLRTVCVCQWSALCDLLTLLWHWDHTVTRSMTPRVPGNHLISTLQNTHTHTQTEDYSKPAPSLIFTPEHSSQIKYFILCFLLSRQISHNLLNFFICILL